MEDMERNGLRPVQNARGAGVELAPARTLVEEIVSRWNPSQIWLFGSRARGTEVPASDWDLLVIVPDATPEPEFEPAIAWALRKRGGVPADIVLCAESDFTAARDVVNTLAYEAAHHGLLIYGRE